MASNKRLNAIITIGAVVSGSLRSAFGEARNETAKLGAEVSKLTARQRELNAQLDKIGKNGVHGDAANQRAQYIQQELAGIGKTIAALRQREAIEQRISDNLKRRAELRGKMADTLALGAAVLLPAGNAVKKSSQFNYELQNIGNTADMDPATIQRLGAEVKKVSDETAKSVQDVEKAAGYLVAAGMEDVGKVMALMRPIGKTATAAAADINDVAKATFTLNDALKIEPADMQRALGSLVQAGKEGNFEFKDMAAELPVLAAGMQALKMTGGEAVATLGAALQIARKGAGSSSEAANNMQNFLAKILSPETLKKAKKLGSDMYAIVNGAQKSGKNPLEAAIAEIDRITKHGDQKLLGELFQDMQVQNFLRPMLQNLDQYQKIKKRVLDDDTGKVVDRDFAKMLGTAKVQMDAAANAAGRLAIAIGTSLEPVVGRTLAAFTPLLRGMADFADAHPRLVGAVVGLAVGLTGLRIAALAGSYAMTFIRGGMLQAAAVATRLGGAGSLLALRVLPLLSGAFATLGAVIMATPVGWIAAGIAAIAVGGLLIYKYWEPLKAFFGEFFTGLAGALAPISQAITDAFAPVWNIIKPLVLPVFDALGAVFRGVVQWVGDILTPIGAAADTTKSFGEAGKVCGEAVAGAFKYMLAPIMAVLNPLKWIYDNIGGIIEKVKAIPGVAKNMLGIGAAGSAPLPDVDAMGNPTGLPAAPPMAPRGGAGGVTDNSQHTYNITQQPGQNAKALAEEIERQRRQAAGVARRSAMVDNGGAQ